MKKVALLFAAALAVAGCKIYLVLPDQPLKVIVVDQSGRPIAAAPDGGADDAATAPIEKPAARSRLDGGPVKLGSKGTLIYVQFTGATTGSGITLYEIDGQSDCAGGSGKKILRRLANDGWWDAQVTLDGSRAICAESTVGSTDGEVVWSVR